MRILATSDWHLGMRQFNRMAPSGINQRETDIALTLGRLIDAAIALAPDCMVVAGDIFHESKPSNAAIIHAYHQLQRLTRALPDVIVVLCGGNHDLSRASTHGDILPLLGTIDRVHIVNREARWLRFPDRELSVLGVPDCHGMARPRLEPDPSARYSVLVLHGEAQGMLPDGRRGGGRKTVEIPLDKIQPARWSYCSLGHWHSYREIAPNCFYSGSIDFTSSDPWSEISCPKGFIERDLETGAHTFHELQPSRRYLDLGPIDAAGMGADELNAAIRAVVDAEPIEGSVVRLVVTNVTREIARALDQKSIRRWKGRALNFQLDWSKPAVEPRAPLAKSYAELRSRSLEDILIERLGKRELPNDVDRAQLTARALAYVEEAKEKVPGLDAPAERLLTAAPLPAAQRRAS